jgi:polysaccharide biosynthesis transport protein
MKPENNLLLNNNGNDAESFFLSDQLPRESVSSGSGGGLRINDVLFILFRHKWKILFFAAMGILTSVGLYLFLPHQYESQAKLLVRYVVDRSVVDTLDPANNKDSRDATSPSVAAINSEIEILTSGDIASAIVKKLGAASILGGKIKPGLSPEKLEELAARSIFKSLEVKVIPDSNILFVVYRNSDPAMAKAVLEELLKDYFDKHIEVHSGGGTYAIVSREADALQTKLDTTTEQLKALKAQAGVTSLAEDTTALATAISKTQEELDTARGELAAQRARVGEMQKLGVANQEEAVDAFGRPKKAAPLIMPSSEIVSKYKGLLVSIAKMREDLTTTLARYTAGNRISKNRQDQIDSAVRLQVDLENKYPALLEVAATVTTAGGNSSTPRLDPIAERARLVELETRVATLGPRLEELKKRSAVLAELGPKIALLQQQFEIDTANFKYYGASLEKARLDERLDPARIPNISTVEAPSAPVLAKRDLKKIIPISVGGGLAIGLIWALLVELVFDRTIKRAGEVEGRLRIPLLMSIPALPARSLRLRDREDEDPDADALGEGSLLAPFCEAIRDQLGLFFELNNMRHKPKLVAVTGLSNLAGTSTLAAGLATALAETAGAKKVCLVDKMAPSRKFYDTLLEFKASDLDYVVFDMPPIGETSATASLAGFMDKLLLVVEAEKSTQAAIKRAYSSLASKVDVSVIFNKRKSYGPRWLEAEV